MFHRCKDKIHANSLVFANCRQVGTGGINIKETCTVINGSYCSFIKFSAFLWLIPYFPSSFNLSTNKLISIIMLNLVVLSLAIIASKAALSCNGASYTYNGEEMFKAAGVCTGTESISPEYAAIFSTQSVCKDGQIYTVTYASSSD
eukprot:522110_1